MKICKHGGCLRIAQKEGYCKGHWKPLKRSEPTKRGDYDHIYSSGKWKRLRNRFIKENPLCIECMKWGLLKETEIVDHIIPIRDGGEPFKWSNLQPLCREHHGEKTARERAQ